MMIKEKRKLVIRRTLQDTFDFITNDDLLHQWVNGIVSVSPVGEHKGGVGDSVNIVVNIPRTMEIVSTITEWKPPHKMTISYSSDGMSGSMSYRLESTEEGCELTFTALHKPESFAMKLFTLLIGFIIKKERKLELQRLKVLLEEVNQKTQILA